MHKKLGLGLSELLAMVIGIAITITIGIMLYTFMPNLTSTLTQQQKISATVVSSTVTVDGAAIISLSIKNLGTKAIESIRISLVNENQTLEIIMPRQFAPLSNEGGIEVRFGDKALTPGQEIPVVVKIAGRRRISSGTKIELIIEALFVDESISTVVLPVLIT